jgi:hypothetical protein
VLLFISPSIPNIHFFHAYSTCVPTLLHYLWYLLSPFPPLVNNNFRSLHIGKQVSAVQVT